MDIGPLIKHQISVTPYPQIRSILAYVPWHELFESLLVSSSNNCFNKNLSSALKSVFRDDTDLVWTLLEQRLGHERYETLDVNSLEYEFIDLQSQLDCYIGSYLPTPNWFGEFTFNRWIGPNQMLILMDHHE